MLRALGSAKLRIFQALDTASVLGTCPTVLWTLGDNTVVSGTVDLYGLAQPSLYSPPCHPNVTLNPPNPAFLIKLACAIVSSCGCIETTIKIRSDTGLNTPISDKQPDICRTLC